MITFNYETEFSLTNEDLFQKWVKDVVFKRGADLGELNYIFCDDEYLHKLNLKYLNHDTYTDVISFDNSLGKLISGDIFISVERVEDNASKYGVTKEKELSRVMIHGVLHFLGFKDKSKEEKLKMRSAENTALDLLSSYKSNI